MAPGFSIPPARSPGPGLSSAQAGIARAQGIARLTVADRMEIEQVIELSTLFADLGDYDRAASFYTRDAELDYSSAFGPDGANMPVDQFWTAVREFVPYLDSVQHQISNLVVRQTDEAVLAFSSVWATQVLGGETSINGGVYRHHMVRTVAGWQIRHLTYWLRFEAGPDLVSRARTRASQ